MRFGAAGLHERQPKDRAISTERAGPVTLSQPNGRSANPRCPRRCGWFRPWIPVGGRSLVHAAQFVGQRVEPATGAAFAPARVLAAVEEGSLLDEQEPGAVVYGTPHG